MHGIRVAVDNRQITCDINVSAGTFRIVIPQNVTVKVESHRALDGKIAVKCDARREPNCVISNVRKRIDQLLRRCDILNGLALGKYAFRHKTERHT